MVIVTLHNDDESALGFNHVNRLNNTDVVLHEVEGDDDVRAELTPHAPAVVHVETGVRVEDRDGVLVVLDALDEVAASFAPGTWVRA